MAKCKDCNGKGLPQDTGLGIAEIDTVCAACNGSGQVKEKRNVPKKAPRKITVRSADRPRDAKGHFISTKKGENQ